MQPYFFSRTLSYTLRTNKTRRIYPNSIGEYFSLMNVLLVSLLESFGHFVLDCDSIHLKSMLMLVRCCFTVKISSGLCDLAELVDKFNTTHANKLNLRHINSLFHRKGFPSFSFYFNLFKIFSCFPFVFSKYIINNSR